MSYIGNTKIGKMYLGNTEIAKAYLGDTLVFQKGGSGPTPVFYDRLVFDGTAYIETDIIPDANASFRVPIGNETIRGPQRIFMLSCNNSALTGAVLNSATTSTSANRWFSVYYGSSSSLLSDVSVSASSDRYVFFLTPKRVGTGTDAITITKGSETPRAGVIFGSNVSHSGQAYTGKFGTIRIYGSDAQNATDANDLLNNYTPAYTLRPCTYNGEAGLWCVETSTFYGNSAGSGTLTVQNNS